jgi:hypothetical protein
MNWSKIISVLSNSNTWAAVSGIASAIAAIAAMFTVYHSRVSWENERESKRPYFIIEKPGIKPLEKSPPFRIQINMENKGTHAAKGLEGKIMILKADLSSQPEFVFNFSIANAIPSNSPTPWYNDTLILPKDLPPQFVVLAIKYTDEILDKSYNQVFYMTWHGVENGLTHPDFVHTSKDDAIKIESYLKEVITEFNKNLLTN